MSKGARIGLLVVGVVILVAAFIALRPSAEDEGSTAQTPTETPSVAAPTETTAADGTPTPSPTPTPRPTVDPGPVLTGDEVEDIRVDKDETVRFQVRPPEDEEVHIHGYNISKDVKAGETTKIVFKADIDGIFEIEFEHSGTPIAELRVDP
jgi:hypothetical protein